MDHYSFIELCQTEIAYFVHMDIMIGLVKTWSFSHILACYAKIIYTSWSVSVHLHSSFQYSKNLSTLVISISATILCIYQSLRSNDL